MHSRKGVVNATAGLATIDIRTARGVTVRYGGIIWFYEFLGKKLLVHPPKK